LCGIEYIVPLIDWLKHEIPDGKFVLSFDNKFVYKEDGTKIEIPKELLTCGECPKKMLKEYKGWPDQHPLPDYLVKNVFGSWEEVEEFYKCPHDSKIRRNAVLRRAALSPGYSHFKSTSKFRVRI
jgi:hypothetical protein